MVDMQLIHGDCVIELAKLPENSVDSVVCDPPYDLTSGGTTGFMGKSWDGSGVAFRAETWREVIRILKPGGYLLAFGGTRTHHRLMCAIEDAEFEIRDTLSWMYGSGFPKSLAVDKAIDRMAGVKPIDAGPYIAPDGKGRTNDTGITGGRFAAGQGETWQEKRRTSPSTDAAKEWDGWGTALKPAWEPIILARKPIGESTVASNVLKYGTGALNINASRIAGSWERSTTHKEDIRGGNFHADNGNKQYEVPPQVSPEGGRWPANVTLSHTSECVQIGQRKVKGYVINRFDDGAKPFGDGAGHPYTSESFGDEDGNETIDVWECVEECPIRLLDEQAGEHPGCQTPSDAVGTESLFRPEQGGYQKQGPIYPDSGGPSRYFYTSKSSVWEREAGLADHEKRFLATMGDGIGAREHNEYEPTAWRGNNHPTVKPLDLMRWLIKLVTRPGGTVLDPFMGSGSTGCAAVIEGMNFMGIDQDDLYVEIAKKRIEYWKRYQAPYVTNPELARQVKSGQIIPVAPPRPKPVDKNQLGLF